MTPLLVTVAKETCTPLHDLYGWAVTEFLYYASYLIETERRNIIELKKLKLKK